MVEAKVKVFRKSSKSPKAHLDVFHVDVRPAQTVLDVLHAILYEKDPTLSFRRSCRSAICGSCAMRINGRSRLACNTQALELVERDGHLLVEPLKNLRVVKDLAVDMSGFWKPLKAVKPSLVEAKDATKVSKPIPGKAFDPLKIVGDCIMCSACLSECTVKEVDSTYLGPAALAKAYRFVGDPRDAATKSRLELYSRPGGIWDCDTCLMCNEVCPMGVKPLDAILRMREAAIEHGLVHNSGARHALAFAATVERTGRLNEASTAIRSLRGAFLRPSNLSLTARAFLKGKRPRLLSRPLRGHGEVRKLIASVQNGR